MDWQMNAGISMSAPAGENIVNQVVTVNNLSAEGNFSIKTWEKCFIFCNAENSVNIGTFITNKIRHWVLSYFYYFKTPLSK